MHPEFEAVMGLEVHVQLATQSKIFCSCPARSVDGQSVGEMEVNSNVCPVCAGHPGTLPTLNKKVIEYAVLAGLALDCEVHNRSVFSRKNYFYPDLPKGYQISQFDRPLCEKGYLEIELSQGDKKRIGITRIHIEEDAGKNVHMTDFSVVNLNRAGVPLVEIVSEPDFRSAEEAGAYLRALYGVVTYTGICDGNLQEGNFRCDVNVSVRRKGETKLGTRTEIKNVNSFKFVEKAIEYEVDRQIQVIQDGGTIRQETRLFDSVKGVTVALRSKEDAHDYRYFPEPDLLPLQVSDELIQQIQSKMPELPSQMKARFQNDYGLSAYDAGVITLSKEQARFFEDSVKLLGDTKEWGKPVSNFLTGEIARLSNEENKTLSESAMTSKHLAEVTRLVKEQVISATAGKQVIADAWATGDSVDSIVEKRGLKQVSDTSALEPIVDALIAAHPDQVAQYRSGKTKLLGFFVGQAMKEMQGKANPALLKQLVEKKLS